MSSTVELLEAQVIALKEFDGRIPGGIDGIRMTRDPELLELLRCSQSVVRLAQATVAAVSGEIARRSEYDGDGSLARRAGERSAVGLVAKQAGVSTREAVSIVKVGEAIRPREALSGEELQPERPRVAGALASGRLSVPLAELIQDTLTKLAPVLWADQAEELEAKLVAMATEQGCPWRTSLATANGSRTTSTRTAPPRGRTTCAGSPLSVRPGCRTDCSG